MEKKSTGSSTYLRPGALSGPLLCFAGMLMSVVVLGAPHGRFHGDDANGNWTATGSLATARFEHTATLLPNGTVLVAGGLDDSGKLLASTEFYDPASGNWSTTGASRSHEWITPRRCCLTASC